MRPAPLQAGHPLGRRRAGGAGLIACLVTLLVVAAGALAVAALNLGLARGAESMRQQGDALRAAQRQIEQSRTSPTSEPDAADPGEAFATTRLSARHRVDGREHRVEVAWTDRAGAQASILLATRIAPLDATGLGVLAFGGPTLPLWPDDRHPAIPPDAARHDRRHSLWTPSPSGPSYRIDNLDAAVTARCIEGSANASDACEAFEAYLVSGFVRFGPGVPAGLRLRADRPFTVTPVGAAPAPASLECLAQGRVAWRDPATGHVEIVDDDAPPGAGFTQRVERFLRYACVVATIDGDRDPLTPPRWSGRLDPNPDGWTIGSGADAYGVERMGPETRDVAASLDGVNFVVVRAGTIGGS